MIRRATPQHKIDERRFRLRLRFTLPVGEGQWPWSKLHAWLTTRLGREHYALHGDYWEGHGLNCYAFHFDDHAIISEFLSYFETLEYIVTRVVRFRATILHNDVPAVRAALFALQSRLVTRLNTPVPVVSWTLGRCEPLNWSKATLGERRYCDGINKIGEIEAAFSVAPVESGAVTVTIQDDQRGELEIGFNLVRDLRPTLTAEEAASIRLFLNALNEVME